MTRARKLRLGGAAFLLAALFGVNVLAYGHAWTMTHFMPGGVRTGRPEALSLTQKLSVVARGVQLPRPVNNRTPLDLQMTYETWTIPD